MMLFDGFHSHDFQRGQSLLHQTFAESTYVLYLRMMSKWIARFLGLFMHSLTSLLKETAGIACPIALLLKVNHRDCALPGVLSNHVSQHIFPVASVQR